MSSLARCDAALFRSLIRPKRLKVSDWLDANRVIPREYASAFKGVWRTSRTPYLREPLDAFNDPAVEDLVLMFASQIGKTELVLGTLLYAYSVDPDPGMFVMPTLDDVGRFSSKRLMPALLSCPNLNVGTASRTEDASKLSKTLNGVSLTLRGSNSASGLASEPVRYLWLDEADKYEAIINVGDPIDLAVQRTAGFARRKRVYTSTPLVKGSSRIEELYQRSDQRRYWTPCPRPPCGKHFVVRWAHVKWDREEDGTHLPDTARIECPACGARITDRERREMFAAGEWRADNPQAAGRVRGYHLWAVACSWMNLSTFVSEFVRKKDDPESLQTFINERLAETWEEPSLVKIEALTLMDRRESYAAEVPAGAKVLTAGVDTQDDRLEAYVWGWGAGEESWLIAGEMFPGDPGTEPPWRELDVFLKRAWAREGGGTSYVQQALVDCRGHKADSVYRAIRSRQARRVFAAVGYNDKSGKAQLVEVKNVETQYGNIYRVVVSVNEAKSTIYGRLGLEDDTGLPRRSGPGVVHFPESASSVFFDQFTSEHKVRRMVAGQPSQSWDLRPGRRRNEALDCAVYALGALRVLCPTPARFAEFATKVDAAQAAEPGKKADAGPLARDAGRSRSMGWDGQVGAGIRGLRDGG